MINSLSEESVQHCISCDQNKNILEFTTYQLDKKYPRCKKCIAVYSKRFREKNKEKESKRNKKYHKNNKKKINIKQKAYYNKNKEQILKRQTEHRKTNREQRREWQKNYNSRPEVKEHRRQYEKEKRQNNASYKLRKDISRKISIMLNAHAFSKESKSCVNYLPFTIEKLKAHLENLFSAPENLTLDGKVWMNWKNRGRYNSQDYKYTDDSKKYLKCYDNATWQLDHIIPQSDLPYTSMEEENFKKCWALENLRPLRSDINHSDGVKKIRHKNNRVING